MRQRSRLGGFGFSDEEIDEIKIDFFVPLFRKIFDFLGILFLKIFLIEIGGFFVITKEPPDINLVDDVSLTR